MGVVGEEEKKKILPVVNFATPQCVGLTALRSGVYLQDWHGSRRGLGSRGAAPAPCSAETPFWVGGGC